MRNEELPLMPAFQTKQLLEPDNYRDNQRMFLWTLCGKVLEGF